MKAVVFEGKQNLQVEDVPKPVLTQTHEALIRIKLSTICGSDLHLYHNQIPDLRKGDILGHECMGLVEKVGEGVKNLKPGQKVVVSAVIAEGNCEFCKKGMFSLCDHTNTSKEMEKQYGYCTAGIFGYSHMLGGYPGGQAEYIKVPFADVNCLPVPDDVSDESALLLSDIICTGYHGTELGEVKEGDVVAVWGCGPVGLMALAWSKQRGAARVIGIDCYENRLRVAKDVLKCDVLNYKECDIVETLKKIVPNGPDVVIDVTGFRYSKSFKHTVEKAVALETDSIDAVTEAIIAVKKGGKVVLIGDYVGTANHFPIGAMMEKSLTVRGGQVFVQKYWKDLLEKIRTKQFDPSFVITHRMPLERAVEGYQMFDQKPDQVMKIILQVAPELK